MSDKDIIEYIKDDADLYKIFQIIAEIRSKSPDDFNSKNKALNTFKNIFLSHGMDWNRSDYRIRQRSVNDKSYVSIRVGESANVVKLSLITDFIRTINHRIMDECGVCVVAGYFAWDSDSFIVFAVDYFNRGNEDKSMHEYDLIDEITQYLGVGTKINVLSSY